MQLRSPIATMPAIRMTASACLGLLLAVGGGAMAAAQGQGKAVSGKWYGTGQANTGDIARCQAPMEVEVSAADGKISGVTISGGSGRRNFEAVQAPDGKFATTYANSRGQPVNVEGELSSSAMVKSVWNPATCGYRNINLKI
jgi:hypothetical protein